MISVGLTGNVGCGKSTVAGFFSELGAAAIDADALVHELLGEGGAAVAPVLEAFPEAAGASGGIDRRALADAVFSDEGRRRELERLLHPLVVAESRRRLAELAEEGCRLAITEAALLFEAAWQRTAPGSLDRFDRIVVVACDPEVRRRRLLERGRARGLSDEEAEADAERREAAQAPQEDKVRAADFVIDNSGSLEETRRRVTEVHAALLAEAA